MKSPRLWINAHTEVAQSDLTRGSLYVIAQIWAEKWTSANIRTHGERFLSLAKRNMFPRQHLEYDEI